MADKVFISHKNTDATLAESVARRLRSNGIQTYLDTIDDVLVKDGPDLADLLLQRMGQCNQLIAVVSDETKDSWWVPWEIGVGSEKNFRMASYSRSLVSLPSYLKNGLSFILIRISIYTASSAKGLIQKFPCTCGMLILRRQEGRPQSAEFKTSTKA